MNAFIFINSVIGFYFGQKLRNYFVERGFFSVNQKNYLHLSFMLYLFTIIFLISCQLTVVIFLIHLPNIILCSLLILFQQRHRKRFTREFPAYLSNVILNMKLGNSFQNATQECLSFQSFYFQQIMSKILDFVFYSQQMTIKLNGFVEEVYLEIKKIDQQPHLSLQITENFLHKLKTINNFRHKSGQILLQTRLQVLVLSMMYLSLFSFMLYFYGWKANQSLFFISFILFLSGTWLIYRVGRGFRWTI